MTIMGKVISAIVVVFLGVFLWIPGFGQVSDDARKASRGDIEFIQDEVDRLKIEVLKTKTQRLVMQQFLKSEALESSFPILTLTHVNEMGSRYEIYSLSYTIDGDRVFYFNLEESPDKKGLGRETAVFKGPLVPGSHDLQVEVIYRGNDSGVFSYINDYKIPSQIKTSLKMDKGQNISVQIVGYEKGWALTDFKDRPGLKVKTASQKGVTSPE